MNSNITNVKLADIADLDIPDPIIFLISYILPPIAFLGIFFNIMILLFLPQNSVLLSKTTKTYYITIAIGDLLSIFSFNILWVFFHDSLSYITSGAFSIELVASSLGCKILYNSWANAEALANYTAIAMSIEQIIALYFPLKARAFLSKKLTLLLIVLCVLPIWLTLTTINLRVDLIQTPGLGPDGDSCGYNVKDDWFLISTYT